MFELAANTTTTITTHRQFVLKNKQIPGYGSSALSTKSTMKRASSKGQQYEFKDDQVDLSTSEGQIKING